MTTRKYNFNPLHFLRDKSERNIFLICVGIAFGFWFAVKITEPYDKDIEIPLAFESPSDNLILTKVPKKKITATISSSGWDLLWVKAPKLTYQIPFDAKKEPKTYREGDLKHDIGIKLSGIEIKALTPDQVTVQLDDKVNKIIPVQFAKSFKIAPQFTQIGETTIQPEKIKVTGPASELDKINIWETEMYKIDNISSSTKNQIGIKPHSNQQVQFEPNVVTYGIAIEQITEKEIIIPIELIGDTTGIKIFPNTVKAKCSVGLSSYDRLNSSLFKASVNADDLKYNKAPIIFAEPYFIKNVQYELDSVQYLIFK